MVSCVINPTELVTRSVYVFKPVIYRPLCLLHLGREEEQEWLWQECSRWSCGCGDRPVHCPRVIRSSANVNCDLSVSHIGFHTSLSAVMMNGHEYPAIRMVSLSQCLISRCQWWQAAPVLMAPAWVCHKCDILTRSALRILRHVCGCLNGVIPIN
jgi:hypothetical protein